MSIHHATNERAKKLGVMLEERQEDGVPVYTAIWPKRNQRLEGENPKLLVDEMSALIDMTSNYRSFTWKEEDDGQKTVSVKLSNGPFKQTADYLHQAFDAARKAWQEDRVNLGDDEDAEGEDETESADPDDEPEKGGSVVDPRYRAKYAEAGHPNHCGDELAEVLQRETVNDAGSNIELFEEICHLNGVDTSKYNRTTHGWQGRIRMTGRNLLGPKLYFAGGLLKLPSERTHQMGDEWMATQRYKAEGKKGKKTGKLKTTPVADTPVNVIVDADTPITVADAPTPEMVDALEEIQQPVVHDRFGVNPPDLPAIEPKGPRKSRSKKAA